MLELSQAISWPLAASHIASKHPWADLFGALAPQQLVAVRITPETAQDRGVRVVRQDGLDNKEDILYIDLHHVSRHDQLLDTYVIRSPEL